MDKISKTYVGQEAWKTSGRPKAVLKVTGADTLSFLQGQFTQELRSKLTAPAAYGLWLNQKGKVVAESFVLVENAESAWVISFTSEAKIICERLESYLIADEVVIADETDGWVSVSVGGAGAASWLERQVGKLPPVGEFGTSGEAGLWFRGRRAAEESWEWLQRAPATWPEGLMEISAEVLMRIRIAAGIAAVPTELGIGDLPNEGGLDAVAVSYTKGCYLGQEVMARLKAMGQVRRKLLRVAGVGESPAVPSALLQGETRVGELRAAVTDGAGGWIGLAMFTLMKLEATTGLTTEPGGGDAHIHLIDTR
jgi:tRNA-modifying protein YgfZ